MSQGQTNLPCRALKVKIDATLDFAEYQGDRWISGSISPVWERFSKLNGAGLAHFSFNVPHSPDGFTGLPWKGPIALAACFRSERRAEAQLVFSIVRFETPLQTWRL